MEALLPMHDLKQKYDEKYESNSLFQEFFDLIDFNAIFTYFNESPGSDFATYLTKYNVDWLVYYNKTRDFFDHAKEPEVMLVLL